jgi:hypothetical protein
VRVAAGRVLAENEAAGHLSGVLGAGEWRRLCCGALLTRPLLCR